MEDTRVTLQALALLLAVVVVLVGLVVASPSGLVLLATVGAWANLAWLLGVTIGRKA
ncbi:hypothetical protein [Azospirillum halopraeferens]|uniref:hypothetical protein n=1 Tax=Azospirillum halopraeferens TaxID=34010 RepID=UPI000413A143|nr:hypothetical protein [Azospirillum halopraeferens]